jgi:hypothetical protein
MLTTALACGRQDMADLLRSFGAKESPPKMDLPVEGLQEAILLHFEAHFGPVHHLALVEIVPVDPPVSVHLVPAGTGRNFITLFTVGMSERAIIVPSGKEEYRYAELLIKLPPDWRLEEKELADPNYSWPVQWLRRIARYPHANSAWLGEPPTIIANGDPPQPLAPNTTFTSLLLMEESAFGRLSLKDERTVLFYSMYPLYTEERALELREGILRLIELFMQHRFSEVVAIDRPNVALS